MDKDTAFLNVVEQHAWQDFCRACCFLIGWLEGMQDGLNYKDAAKIYQVQDAKAY